MALILKKSMELYKYLIVDLADKRVDHLPIVHSPISVIFLLTCYMLFVFKLGPSLMKNLKPFKLKEVLLGFNALQMFANAYIIYNAFPIIQKFHWFCEPIDYGSSKDAVTLSFLAWIYYMLKVADLLDTVFFVLRKKYNQVTFLHVYHHALMVLSCWFFTKYFAGGHSAILGYFNAFVHIVMYGYYLLSAMNDGIKANPWWKKYITQLQLFQFMLIYIVYIPMIFMPTCQFNKLLLLMILPQNTLMVYLFSKFYYRTYIKEEKKRN